MQQKHRIIPASSLGTLSHAHQELLTALRAILSVLKDSARRFPQAKACSGGTCGHPDTNRQEAAVPKPAVTAGLGL